MWLLSFLIPFGILCSFSRSGTRSGTRGGSWRFAFRSLCIYKKPFPFCIYAAFSCFRVPFFASVCRFRVLLCGVSRFYPLILACALPFYGLFSFLALFRASSVSAVSFPDLIRFGCWYLFRFLVFCPRIYKKPFPFCKYAGFSRFRLSIFALYGVFGIFCGRFHVSTLQYGLQLPLFALLPVFLR